MISIFLDPLFQIAFSGVSLFATTKFVKNFFKKSQEKFDSANSLVRSYAEKKEEQQLFNQAIADTVIDQYQGTAALDGNLEFVLQKKHWLPLFQSLFQANPWVFVDPHFFQNSIENSLQFVPPAQVPPEHLIEQAKQSLVQFSLKNEMKVCRENYFYNQFGFPRLLDELFRHCMTFLFLCTRAGTTRVLQLWIDDFIELFIREALFIDSRDQTIFPGNLEIQINKFFFRVFVASLIFFVAKPLPKKFDKTKTIANSEIGSPFDLLGEVDFVHSDS